MIPIEVIAISTFAGSIDSRAFKSLSIANEW